MKKIFLLLLLSYFYNPSVSFAQATIKISKFARAFADLSLIGEQINKPTSLQFGPDGRLYVSQQNGLIHAYTIEHDKIGEYEVVDTEFITDIQEIQNHNDDGTLNELTIRQVTGLLVTGTADNVIIYASSSDSRIGGGGSSADVNLDTNSSMISRLTQNGNDWDRVDLVRGLPRSEENHAANGMQLKDNILYIAQGGNTNAGAPSNNFAFLTEYALSAAILTVDLTAIDAMPIKTHTDDSKYIYDIPTLDDPTRENVNGQDINDPFGGNDGLNQAKLVEGGPIQVFASGFRNIYDLVITEDDHVYTWDNGANGGWGGHPDNEGGGSVTNNWVAGEPGSNGPGPNDDKVNNLDGLHFVNSTNYYGGHPTPIRANPTGAGLYTNDGTTGVWRTSTTGDNPLPIDWPPVPPSLANPIEGDFQNAGVDDMSIFTVPQSTNGIVEYTASIFNTGLKGNLLAVSFSGNLYSIERNSSGGIDNDDAVTILAQNFGETPLDITAQGDDDIFPGTIWVANLGGNSISIFEPQDLDDCIGANEFIDEDGDLYTNSDELDNGTDPCNAASTPMDFDKTLINGFLVSNLNDTDDDDDGILDTMDPFAWDATNGANTNIPVDYPLLNTDPGTGFFGLGFTGLMSNGTSDYLDLILDENNSSTEIIAGGAVGLLTFNDIPNGDPYTNLNSQQNGFQFGINVDQNTAPFYYEGKLLGPVFSITPKPNQSAGIYIGTGDQSNYLKVVINGNENTTGLQILYEEDDAIINNQQIDISNIGFESELSLFLFINPSTGEVHVKYAIGNSTPVDVGQVVQLQNNVLATLQSNTNLAVGILSTSNGTSSTFNATWDYLKLQFSEESNNIGNWIAIDDGENCNAHGQAGSCAQGRHECAYVQVGDKFYLIGGKEQNSNVNIYDPATDIWTIGADAPYPVNHAQGVSYDGLIYLVGSFKTDDFPNEQPNPRILIYDPLADQWIEGPMMPQGRLRASAGVVVYENKIYIVNGIQNGHSSGWVNWFDVFDPITNTWEQLPNSPRTRDHFHAIIDNNKLYVVGGRNTGQSTTQTPTIGEVDVYDFQTESWSTLINDLPTERAGCTVGILENKLIVIGGERNSGNANNDVEALDLTSYTWRSLAPLLEGRHGTQAITNNGGIYIASGSPIRGGGITQTQEAFFFGEQTTPTGQAILASSLELSETDLLFDENQNIKSITLTNVDGTQGIILQELNLSNTNFVANITQGLPLHIPPGGSVSVQVLFTAGNEEELMGQLEVVHTGLNGSNTTITLDASCKEDNLIIDDDPIDPNTYAALSTIESAGTVIENTSVSFKAGVSITLNPGFLAESNSTFTATIEAIEDCIDAQDIVGNTQAKVALTEPIIENDSAHLLDTATPSISIMPNPFRKQTRINISLPFDTKATLQLFNINGQLINSLAAEKKWKNGIHSIELSSEQMEPGSYILSLIGSKFTIYRKLILIE